MWALEFFNPQRGKISLSLRTGPSGHSLQAHRRASSAAGPPLPRSLALGAPDIGPAASEGALMRGQGPQVRGPRGQRLCLTGSFWQNKEGGRKEKAGLWGQVWVNPRFLTAGPRQAACSGRCSEPGRGHGPQAAPSSPPHSRLPTDLSAPEPEGQSPQGGAWLPGSLGPALDSPTSPGSSLPGERGGTCTWPGQEGKVTHTKLNNQQRHILAAPAPTRLSHSPRAVSSA